MKYYVVADPHGFYTELREALNEKGFFSDVEPHKLIVCGDLMDRGQEALAMQDFILDLIEKDSVILVRGNHEDLMIDLLKGWNNASYKLRHHNTNGTVDTVLQLTGEYYVNFGNEIEIKEKLSKTPFVQKIIPSTVDYFETNNYIFVHGWLPCKQSDDSSFGTSLHYLNHWRKAEKEEWRSSRWLNGMAVWADGIREPGKTIVCGHWHCSYGHCHLENKGSEFGKDADFSPFIQEGIIALDACTALSKKVNCIVIED